VVRRIEGDRSRFREIVRGRIRRDLKRYVSHGELLGRAGKGTVSIPLPQIDLPHFTFANDKDEGVGRGDGDEGAPAPGRGEAGEGEGDHAIEAEVPIEELADILGEELELPRILPKGRADVVSERDRYVGIRRVGPESLRHFRRTFKEALKRQIMSGAYDPERPIVVPTREDRRYRSWSVRKNPEHDAAIIYMMDVSGSMGQEQKEIVRAEAFWIDLWLRRHYKNLKTVYLVHDAAAKEVDHHEFFHLRESGGTKISSAYELCLRIIDERFGGDQWNVYPFHFSDGDNWSGKDTTRCVELLRDAILPRVNQFCYGQVRSAYGSGQFKKDLDQAFGGDERLVTSSVDDRDGILNSIRDFLGKGR
jgi:uncharacterized protein